MRWGVLLVAAVAVGMLFGNASAKAADLKLMSFNIRNSAHGGGEARSENNWSDPVHPRRERVLRVIGDCQPDVLGVQEAFANQVDFLKAGLPAYSCYGVGRDDGKSAGEQSAIFWRTDRFEKLDAGTFWMSDTPDAPGTSFDKKPGALPRIASWVKLRDKTSGREFLVLNTHWDHLPPNAVRLQSAQLIRERLPQLRGDLPAIVMGDFNSTEDSAEQQELSGANDPGGVQLIDSYREVHPDRQPNERSHHAFTGNTDGSRIDFIRHTKELQATAAEIVHTNYDGFWPSDHFPVTATLRFKPVP